jgi:hypothetical protein
MVVRWNVGRFRDCYQRALVASPKLTGHVSVRFWIDAEGQARDAAVEATDLPTPVAACITGAFGQLRFPALEGGPIGVRYGFLLGPDGALGGAEPTSEARRANRYTPSDDADASSAAPDGAQSRLFRIFLAGLEQGPSAPPIDSTGAAASRSAEASHPSSVGEAGPPTPPVPSRAGRCAAFDPLCDEL